MAPPSQDNPFASLPSTNLAPEVQEGSFGLGVVLGGLFGLWGLIGTMVFAKPETKRGARYGFGGRLLLTLVVACGAIALDG
jgi:hypothetical protein